MDLLGQMLSPKSLPQLEAAVFLPFGLALAVGPFWAAFVAIATTAVVWLWWASSPPAAKVAGVASAVPTVTSLPNALFPLPATSSSPEAVTAARTSPCADAKGTAQAQLPALAGEHEPFMRSSSRKVKWVFIVPDINSSFLGTDDGDAAGSEDAVTRGGLTSSSHGRDVGVAFSGNELTGMDDDGATIGSWVAKEALRWTEVGIGKGNLGWYAYQDRTVISGSVVRLWEGERSPRRRPHAIRE